MKYDVTYSCGHTGTVELYGKTSERESKIRWYETTLVKSFMRWIITKLARANFNRYKAQAVLGG